jgi:hypothetical protein
MEQYCDGENAWLLERYKGQFNITTLEPGPKAVVDVLVERTTHNCFKSPIADADKSFWVTDLENRWSIVNGIRADHLRDLDTFMRHTDSNSLQLAGQWTETWGTERMTFWRAERRTGPGRGGNDM